MKMDISKCGVGRKRAHNTMLGGGGCSDLLKKSGGTFYSGVFFPRKMGQVIYYFEALLKLICKALDNLRINGVTFSAFGLTLAENVCQNKVCRLTIAYFKLR